MRKGEGMLDSGDKVLVVHRRLFEKDATRYFVGEVLVYDSGIAKVRGYTFVKDMFTGNMQKKSDLRTKLLAIVSGTLIVYSLPSTLPLETLYVCLNQNGGLVLTDNQEFSMDISETVQKHEVH